ncbi:MAG: AraC family transcriptional regulator [Acidobacteria bacterium]|nr:AraC family transcriptional regulator [Acidobacteriota bacterium]MBI3427222.1 AraC family transcriptional regulator [Acidobacteriota bacterium]
MTIPKKDASHQIYQARINRVIDHITENLAEELSLSQLAAVANFSEFHFHRVFRALMNESLNEFITRLRVEKAVRLLRYQPRYTLTDIAVECGFNSLSNFSRTFKKQCGVSPGKIELEAFLKNSKIGQTAVLDPRYYLQAFPADELGMDFPVRIVPTAALRVAYIRCFGLYLDPQKGMDAYARLMIWARANDLLKPDTLVIGMSPDNPEITPLEKCRYDLCLTVGEQVRAAGEVNITTIPATTYALHHCVGDIHKVGQAWNYFFKVWLPASGYQPADQPAMEIFLKLPEEIGWTSFDIECCVPIQALR